ncbi:hypothetical protein K8R47_01200 [archaeon]|nr:hypothetical protein [archaeon]
MTELIICEKPSQALKIAEALADKKPKKKLYLKVPYYELKHKKKDIVVGCAVGHLFGLKEKSGKGWTYPTFNYEWIPTHLISKQSQFSKKYLNTLKKLVKDSKEFTVACDYDLEGSVIGYNCIRFIAKKKNAKRMKFSTLTKKELVESYEKASKTLDFPQIESGETRHTLDWLYGINLTRALTLSIKAAGSFKVLSTGRVQGPALKILSERELEIQKFKPVPFWQLEAINESTFNHKKDKFWDKKEVTKIHKKIKDEKSAIVKKIERKQFQKEPPNPFDLTSLQIEAYKTLKISPKHTLEIAQTLYTNAYISYPRTSSNILPESVNYKGLLTSLKKQKKYTKIWE